jgi:hypothetical protein
MYAALAAQARYYAVYLSDIYGNGASGRWFRARYKASGHKLDMGKSCVRFRSLDDLPFDVIGEAVARTPVERFIATYEASRRRSRRA